MPHDQADPTSLSRRTLLAVAGATPVLCAAGGSSPAPPAETLIGRCAKWLTLDFKSDDLARRWSALETLAASGYDYFRMNDRERRSLPMGPEMEAIEKQLDTLFNQRKRLFKDIAKMTPTNVHEAASLMVIAARIEVHDPGPSAPLIRKAMEFIADGTCPRCGEPYVPKSLPTA
ncbi:MAG: hypothetical protein J7521_00390 [Caulobacter sp.]|nr:hypothetical protein [Caulobacter sp.]